MFRRPPLPLNSHRGHLMRSNPVCRRCLLAAGVFVLLLQGACRTSAPAERFMGLVTPYKVEIVQGNVVTREQAAQLKPGMSRAQVRDILGSPLLADIFHADRWDYVFTIRRPGAQAQTRRVTVRFDGDLMASIEAPELPGEREFIASIDTFKTPSRTAPLSLTDAQLQQLPLPPQPGATVSTPAVVPAARSYPPLEPQ